MKLVILLVALLIALFIAMYFIKSTFIDEINYKSCTRDNREYPEGRVPGSYLGLNKYEREGLLEKFIKNK